jgi:predicted DsbA family dithiol-disulfide isomerase
VRRCEPSGRARPEAERRRLTREERMLVEVYSDVACPWCYIGERRFAKALARFEARDDVEVVFRPYQLDPSAPRASVPLLGALERKFGPGAAQMMARVTGAAAEEGIEMRMDRARSVNTLDAHRLVRLAEREEGPAVQRALMERLFEAYFTAGGDVGDRALLADLAAASGLDRARVDAYLASDEGLSEVRAEIEEARSLGITAVPTFVFDGRYAVSGAQAPELFLDALREAAKG